MRTVGVKLFLLAVLVAFEGSAAPRILFSNYANETPAVNLNIDGESVSRTLGFGETDARYRLVEAGNRAVSVVTATNEVLLADTFTLTDGDYSLFWFIDDTGSPLLRLDRDPTAAFNFPAPFDFETADANAAGRILGLGGLQIDGALRLTAEVTQVVSFSNGETDARTVYEDETAFDGCCAGGTLGSFVGTVNSRVENQVEISAGLGATGEIAGSFLLPPGTTDYVVARGPDGPTIFERARPGALNASIDGLYGEPGIAGSGMQLFELPDLGRIFGFIYSYDSVGSPVWYYIDSRCDLERGFQCSTPGFLVASGTYIVAAYRADGGAPVAGPPALLTLVGSGRLRVSRDHLSTPTADPLPVTASVLISLKAPTPGRPPDLSQIDINLNLERLTP